MFRLITASLLLATMCQPALAAGKDDLKQAHKKRRALYSKFYRIMATLDKNPELKKLRSVQQKARKALNDKVATTLKSEKAAERKARTALNKAIEAQAEASDDMKTLRKKQQTIKIKQRDLSFQIALIRLYLTHNDSAIQRQIDLDADVVAAGKKRNQGTSAQRNKAWKQYWNLRREKLKSVKAAKPLLAKEEQLKAELKKSRAEATKAWQDSYKIRYRKTRGKEESAEVKKLRAKYQEARTVFRKAYYNDNLKKERLAANKASAAYYSRRRELSKDHKELKKIQDQLNEINKEIKRLSSRPTGKKAA